MLKKIVCFFSLSLFFAFIFQACQEADDSLPTELQLRSPYKVWELEGFAIHDNEGRSFRSMNSVNNIQLYTVEKLEVVPPLLLDLKKEGTFIGTTPANNIRGDFLLDYRGAFSFTTIDSSDRTEGVIGSRYISCLHSVSSYAVFEKTLHLYYTKDKSLFLLYTAAE